MPPTDHELDPDLATAVTDIEALGVPGWAALSVGSGRRVEADLFGGADAGADGDPTSGTDRDGAGAAVSTCDFSYGFLSLADRAPAADDTFEETAAAIRSAFDD